MAYQLQNKLQSIILALLALGAANLHAQKAIAQEYPAEIIAPAAKSLISQPTVRFTWSLPSPGASCWLDVGTNPGKTDIFSQDMETNNSALVTNIPTGTARMYARVWTKMHDRLYYQDYRYKTLEIGARPARMIYPANGSLLTKDTIEFRWDRGCEVSEYWLSAGTSLGTRNILHVNLGQAESAVVPGIPENGELIFVRLWSKIGELWCYKDYVYSTMLKNNDLLSNRDTRWMITPRDSSILGASVVFQWHPVKGAARYILKLGSSPGRADVCYAATGSETSVKVAAIDQNLNRVYARLEADIEGRWVEENYVYATTKAYIKTAEVASPPAGTTLPSSSVTFTWAESKEASEYRLSVGSSRGENDIYCKAVGKNTSAKVEGIPSQGQVVYVRLESCIRDYWYYKDYTYGTADLALEPALMQSPFPGSLLQESRVEFDWDGGENVSEYRLDAGTEKGRSDICSLKLGRQKWATVDTVPQNGQPVFIRLWSRIEKEWIYTDYQYATGLSHAGCAKITRLMDNADLPGKTVILEWEDGGNFADYRLQVHTRLDQNTMFDQTTHGKTYAVINNIDSNSTSRLFVRLWSKAENTWNFENYVFQVGNKDAIPDTDTDNTDDTET